MKNILAALIASSALLGAQAANAAIFRDGGQSYTFAGSVTVAKDLSPLQCDLEVTIAVPEDAPDAHGTFSHGDSATATAVFTGGDLGCAFINVAGTADVIYSLVGGQEYLTFDRWTITPPFSMGQCVGPIKVRWYDASPAGATTSWMEADTPLSDSTATLGADCVIVGPLYQVSPTTPQLQID